MTVVVEDSDILLARQPIYDRKLNVVAYELLFRGDSLNRAEILDDAKASSEVLINAYASNIELITAGNPAFVNMSEQLIALPDNLPFPKDHIVFEILETVPVTPSLVSWVKKTSAQGYKIALDDFNYSRQYDPLLPLVDYIKIDLMAMDRARLQQHMKLLKPLPAKLLAEKVETHEEFQHCLDIGFELFQGYFLSRPKIMTGKKIKTSGTIALRILQELQDPNVTPENIERLMTQDTALTYKLLKIINSAAFGLPRTIESVKEAIVFIGLMQLRSWLTLLALSSVSDKPSSLFQTLFIRGHMCQSVAEKLRYPNGHVFFTAGLFSGLDAVLDMPLEEALSSIPLADMVRDGILNKSGDIGNILDCVLAYETGHWERWDNIVIGDSKNVQSKCELFSQAYIDSVTKAEELAKSLG